LIDRKCYIITFCIAGIAMPAQAKPHDHDHGHATTGGHVHSHVLAGRPHPRNAPGRSLLRMSLGERLGIAGVFVAGIWLAVFWATA
jgi:hypothetical protein